MKKETEKQVAKIDDKPISGDLVGDIRSLIETARRNVAVSVNAGLTILYWQIGSFLRSKGLHQTHREQWRLQMLKGLQNNLTSKKAKKRNSDSKRIRSLEKELNRKEKAPAETAALLVLKKKSGRYGGTRTIPQPGAMENDFGAYL